ncbi:MAG: hypothetical protein RMJ32_05795, partial [Aquificaceae bacterium]|nr:hypothetical protein [Aquificaceae bacterium]
MVALIYLLGFLSITLFEALMIILLPASLYSLRRKSWGLFLPLALHALAHNLSTAFYAPHGLMLSLERSLLLFNFSLGNFLKLNELFLNRLIIASGILILPYSIYTYIKTSEPSVIWGGWFETGAFYSLFCLSSLALFIKSGRIHYLFLAAVFAFVVILTARRSSIIALLLTILIIVFLFLPKRKAMLVSFAILSFLTSLSVLVFLKDPRAIALFEGFDFSSLDRFSSNRLELAKRGLEVLLSSFYEGRWFPLLFGYGVLPGARLEPPSHVGGTYESVFFISEAVEKGIVGL